MKFCQSIESLFGSSAVTPNMHMHAHLKEVVKDFGPVYAFWLFSYERYNGILGHQPNNNKSIETQLMNRFMSDNKAYAFDFPKQYCEDFSSLIPSDDNSVGSLSDTVSANVDENVKFVSAGKRDVFGEEDRKLIETLYHKLDPENDNSTVSNLYYKFASVLIKGKRYGCSYGKSSCVAMALWNDDVFGPPPTPVVNSGHPDSKLRPIKIQHFVKTSVQVGSSINELNLAVVLWHRPHYHRNLISKPVQVWCHNVFEDGGLYSFLPTGYIKCRCAFGVECIEDESLSIIIPLVE